MVTAKRGREKRKLQAGELVFLVTPSMLNQRTSKLKKGAIIHMGRKLISSGTMLVACERDLGRVYEIPFNHFVYQVATICLRCKEAVGEIKAVEKTFY